LEQDPKKPSLPPPPRRKKGEISYFEEMDVLAGGLAAFSVVDPDPRQDPRPDPRPDPHPDPHNFCNLDPHPDPNPHQIKILIQIRIII
jgi:hypothetical protein